MKSSFSTSTAAALGLALAEPPVPAETDGAVAADDADGLLPGPHAARTAALADKPLAQRKPRRLTFV
jgi:hypothetical protein